MISAVYFFGEFVSHTLFLRFGLFQPGDRKKTARTHKKSQLSLFLRTVAAMKATLQFQIRPNSNFSQILTSLMKMLKVDSYIASRNFCFMIFFMTNKTTRGIFEAFFHIFFRHSSMVLTPLQLLTGWSLSNNAVFLDRFSGYFFLDRPRYR